MCSGYPAWHDPQKTGIDRLKGEKGKPFSGVQPEDIKYFCQRRDCGNEVAAGEVFCDRCESNLRSWTHRAVA